MDATASSKSILDWHWFIQPWTQECQHDIKAFKPIYKTCFISVWWKNRCYSALRTSFYIIKPVDRFRVHLISGRGPREFRAKCETTECALYVATLKWNAVVNTDKAVAAVIDISLPLSNLKLMSVGWWIIDQLSACTRMCVCVCVGVWLEQLTEGSNMDWCKPTMTLQGTSLTNVMKSMTRANRHHRFSPLPEIAAIRPRFALFDIAR